MATQAQVAAYRNSGTDAPTLTPSRTPVADPEVTDDIVDQIAWIEAQRRGTLRQLDDAIQARRWASSVPAQH